MQFKEKLLTDENKNPISPIVNTATVYNGFGDSTIPLDTYVNSTVIDVSDAARVRLDLKLDPRSSNANSGRRIIDLQFSDNANIIITDVKTVLSDGRFLLINLPPYGNDATKAVQHVEGKRFCISVNCEIASSVKVNTNATNKLVDNDITQPCVKSYAIPFQRKELICTKALLSDTGSYWIEMNEGLVQSKEILPQAMSEVMELKVPTVGAVRKYVNDRQKGITQAEYNNMIATGRIDPTITYIIKY